MAYLSNLSSIIASSHTLLTLTILGIVVNLTNLEEGSMTNSSVPQISHTSCTSVQVKQDSRTNRYPLGVHCNQWCCLKVNTLNFQSWWWIGNNQSHPISNFYVRCVISKYWNYLGFYDEFYDYPAILWLPGHYPRPLLKGESQLAHLSFVL